MSEQEFERDELESLLPEYVNGSLSEADKRRVDEALAQDNDEAEALKQELAFLQALRDELKSEAVQSPSDWGWASLQRDLEASESAIEDQPRPEDIAQETSPIKPSGGGWRLVALAASFFLMVQTSYIVFDSAQIGGIDGGVGEEYRTLSGEPLGPRLDVQFRAGLSEEKLRETLIELDGRIIDGPSALGVYQLYFPDTEAARAELTLRGLVEYAERIE